MGLVFAINGWLFRPRVFAADTSLDVGTFVAPSTIPGAGQGLFAAQPFKKGERIAEMGGALVFEAGVPQGKRGYLFRAPDCARGDLWPFDALDGTLHGGRGSKINFAPRTLNGVDTQLQNARGREMCDRPYIFFEATRDIEPGEEILTSYGSEYRYDFMESPAVREHFCARTGQSCDGGFVWKP